MRKIIQRDRQIFRLGLLNQRPFKFLRLPVPIIGNNGFIRRKFLVDLKSSHRKPYSAKLMSYAANMLLKQDYALTFVDGI